MWKSPLEYPRDKQDNVSPPKYQKSVEKLCFKVFNFRSLKIDHPIRKDTAKILWIDIEKDTIISKRPDRSPRNTRIVTAKKK